MRQLGCYFSGNGTGRRFLQYCSSVLKSSLSEILLHPMHSTTARMFLQLDLLFSCSVSKFLAKIFSRMLSDNKSFFFSYTGSFSPLESLLCHKCSFPLAPRFKKRHRKMKSGDNTQCSITRAPAWRHFCFAKKMSNKFCSIKVTRSQFKEKERQFQHESLLYKFCKLQKKKAVSSWQHTA